MRVLSAWIAAIAGLGLPGIALAQEWYFVTERPGYVYFADAASLERTGDIASIEVLQAVLDGPPDSGNNLLSYRFDCSRQTMQLMGGRVFSDAGAELDVPGPYPAPNPVSIESVSPGEILFEFACDGGLRQEPAADPYAVIRVKREEDAARFGGY